MNSQWCNSFYELITKQFAFLIEDYKFRLANYREARSGEYCLIVLKSAHCQARFIAEQGGVNLAMGSISAPPSWDDFIDGNRQWYPVKALLRFLGAIPRLNLKDELEAGTRFISREQRLFELAQQVKPNFGDLMMLFVPANFESWQDHYEQWNEDQAREFREQLAQE